MSLKANDCFLELLSSSVVYDPITLLNLLLIWHSSSLPKLENIFIDIAVLPIWNMLS